VRVVGVSVDSPQQSRAWADENGFTFAILSDEKRAVIRAYDLVHAGGGIGGADIARPAEFLLDREGVVRWRHLTDSYRVRATPETVLKALDELEASAGPKK